VINTLFKPGRNLPILRHEHSGYNLCRCSMTVVRSPSADLCPFIRRLCV